MEEIIHIISIHKNKESMPLPLEPYWGKQLRTVYFVLRSVLLTPLSTSRVHLIFKAPQSLGCRKDKGWKTEATMPSVPWKCGSMEDLPASKTTGVNEN